MKSSTSPPANLCLCCVVFVSSEVWIWLFCLVSIVKWKIIYFLDVVVQSLLYCHWKKKMHLFPLSNLIKFHYLLLLFIQNIAIQGENTVIFFFHNLSLIALLLLFTCWVLTNCITLKGTGIGADVNISFNETFIKWAVQVNVINVLLKKVAKCCLNTSSHTTTSPIYLLAVPKVSLYTHLQNLPLLDSFALDWCQSRCMCFRPQYFFLLYLEMCVFVSLISSIHDRGCVYTLCACFCTCQHVCETGLWIFLVQMFALFYVTGRHIAVGLCQCIRLRQKRLRILAEIFHRSL